MADAPLACVLLAETDDSPTRRLVTVEYKINFIKPVKNGFVVAEAKVVHLGKELALGEVDVTDQQDRLVAKALITYSVKY